MYGKSNIVLFWSLSCVISLIAKTYRIYRLFQTKSLFKKVDFTLEKGVAIVVIGISLVLVIQFIWIGVAPLVWIRIIEFEDVYGNPVSSKGLCVGSSPASVAFAGVAFWNHCYCVWNCSFCFISCSNSSNRIPRIKICCNYFNLCNANRSYWYSNNHCCIYGIHWPIFIINDHYFCHCW